MVGSSEGVGSSSNSTSGPTASARIGHNKLLLTVGKPERRITEPLLERIPELNFGQSSFINAL